MEKIVTAYKALGDKSRLRIMGALLSYPELCVCQLIELLQVSGASVSQHLFVLKAAGFCLSRKEGRWVYFYINKNSEYLSLLNKELLLHNKEIEKDIDTLRNILSQKITSLCETQRSRKKM